MSKFEYMMADLHTAGGKTWIDHLNGHGAEGWHIVAVDRDTDSHMRVIMERELPEEPMREIDDGRRA